MDFNDQITKTFFINVLNNEMHKTLIGFFIPAIYIVYYTMFHGMNNQFEILRVKDGMTTTVIKITKNFTTVNSTTNDVMDWEFTITSSFTKMVKKQLGFSGHHKEREGGLFSMWNFWAQVG